MSPRRLVATHPAELDDAQGWSASTVPLPMRPLEFDVLARSFADGFSRALSDLFAVAVMVGVRLRSGHLETIKSLDPSGARSTQLDYSFDYLADWQRRVRPVVEDHIQHVASTGRSRVTTRDPASLLRDVTQRMKEVTYLHHTLVLPARLKLVEFAEFAQDHDLVATPGEAMCLLAGRRNATTAIAEELWECRHHTGDPGAIAQEGDGYGLGSPNWLEDSAVPILLRRLYRTLDDAARPAELLSRARRTGERLSATAKGALRDKPSEVGSEFRRLCADATRATQVTEEHAPLMHACLPHELRALTVRLGAALTTAGQLDRPDDIFYLHVDELASGPPADRQFFLECARAHRSEIDHAAPPPREEPVSGDCWGDSVAACLFRWLFQPADGARIPGTLRGHPSSPGSGVGPVRRLFWQRDVGTVRPHDVLVLPESSNGWSYALPAATAVVSESGHPYGHLASLARDYATPAVIGVGDTREVLWDGRLIEVDGSAGEVRLLTDQTRGKP